MAALMGIGIIATLLAQEPETAVKPPRTLYEAVIEPLYEFFSYNAWLIFTIIKVYKWEMPCVALSFWQHILFVAPDFDAGGSGD